MDTITSKENKLYKSLLKLRQKKYRDREGLYILEGPSMVRDALRATPALIERVVLREDAGMDAFDGEAIGKDALVLSGKLFDEISDTENSQGVFALMKKEKDPDLAGIPEKGKGDVIILDRLQDPGNIGTIIRTAEATGINCCLVIKGTSDPFAPKAVRASSGAVTRIPVINFDDAEEAISAVRSKGIELVTTDVNGGKDLFSSGLSEPNRKPAALVIGNEGSGVSETFLRESDIRITIPMKGEIESLNAGAAAAVIMYEMAKPFK